MPEKTVLDEIASLSDEDLKQLEKDLQELESVDPGVAKARKKYDATVSMILSNPDSYYNANHENIEEAKRDVVKAQARLDELLKGRCNRCGERIPKGYTKCAGCADEDGP